MKCWNSIQLFYGCQNGFPEEEGMKLESIDEDSEYNKRKRIMYEY